MFRIFIFLSLLITISFSHGMSEGEKQIIVEGGNFHYMYIGAVHMFFGYDHLLFILGTIFFLNSFKEIVKYVTAFTLGHSITLIWATFNAVSINYYFIDAIIALSVCYIGFVNLKKIKNPLKDTTNMFYVIFLLGLIHGLGLSTRLQQLPLSSDDLLLNILSFNLGIEFGQIFALIIMLVCITIFKKSQYFKNFSLLINTFLILAGIFLFVYQVYEYKNSSTQINTTLEKKDWKNELEIVIPAMGEKEYKLWLELSNILEYSWKTADSSKIYFDLHGEPAGDTTGYFESYKIQTNSEDSGSLTAKFVGTHGWYWKNDTSKDIVINLMISGEYKLMNNKYLKK